MRDLSPTQHTREATARILRLDERVEDDLSDSTTVEERIAMVALLSKRMWEITGRALPSYTRSEMPIRVARRK